MPNAVMQTFLDTVEGGQEVLIATPVIITGFVKQFYECVRVDGDYSVEVVIPPEVFKQSTNQFPEFTEQLLDDKDVKHHTGPIPFNFGLWIVDSIEAGIIVFTDRGVRGTIVNNTAEALDWTTEQYENLKQDAHPATV